MSENEIEQADLAAALEQYRNRLDDETEYEALYQIFQQYLDCPCRYFAPVEDDDIIVKAYEEAQRRGPNEGFVPMLVAVDETLLESLIINSDKDSDNVEGYIFRAAQVETYRQKMLHAPLQEGAAAVASLIQPLRQELQEDGLNWEEEVLGEMAGGEPRDRFIGYWDYLTGNTMPLILAEIPVSHPWEIFVWLPFGGWNACPDTLELMAVAKYWYEQHEAVPVVMTHDVLEFAVPRPVSKEQAMRLALEQYAWCPDVIEQGPEDCTVGLLADMLHQSTTWYFWWD